MRNIFTFARFAQAVALDRLCQNDRRLAFVLGRRLVSRIHLAHVMTAAQQLGDLLVAQMRHEFEQFRIFAEEMFPRVAARLDDIFLIIAVHTFFHALEQQAGLVALDDIVPDAAPDNLDDVPTRATEKSFQFLDDLAVAAHRPVEALQIAIHDPDDVVEALSRRERDGTE